MTIFTDPRALEIFDPDSPASEDRWIRLGYSNHNRVLLVIYCERVSPGRIRIISARKAAKSEQMKYYFRGVYEE
ncbi:BrnT family toxin [Bdellovibrio bacteriovorus]|uniref:BrnT family toxin n=1 Tax=Bdellovibrio bacteriovorus TaxID=959 RepID=UPI0039779B24